MKRLCQGLAAAIVFLIPAYYWRFSVLGLPTNLIEVLVVILGILTAVNLILTHRQPTFPLIVPIVVLVATVFIGALGAPDRLAALGIVKGWFIIPAIFYWSVIQLFSRDRYQWLVIALGLSSLIVAIYGLLQWQGQIGLIGYQLTSHGNLQQYIDGHRVLAFFESPNYLAMFLAPTAALLIWFPLGRYRYVGWLIAIILIGVIILTGSRSGLVALTTATALVAAIKLRSLSAKLGAIGLAGLAVVATLQLIPHGGSGIDNNRFYIWREALAYYRLRPVFGIGPGAFSDYFSRYGGRDPVVYQQIRAYALHPHNLYLALLLAGGPVALVTFIIMLVALAIEVKKLIQTLPLVAGLVAAILVVLTQGLFDTTYFKNDLALIFWLLVAGLVIITNNQNGLAKG